MNLFQKFKETFFSVFPIMAIVLLLSVTVAPLSLNIIVRFIVGGICRCWAYIFSAWR